MECLAPLRKDLKPPTEARAWRFSPSLGLTHLAYTETGIEAYSAILLTAKLGSTYALSDQWNVGASAFMNLTSLSSSDPNVGVRFLGLNARVAFSFPASGSSWKTSIMVGAYSLGMSVSQNALGFDRLLGPQLLVAERKTLNERNAFSAYAKYAPMFAIAGSSLSLSQRELAGGLAYERKMGGNFYSLAVDASVFNFSVGVVAIQSQTLNLSLGMSL